MRKILWSPNPSTAFVMDAVTEEECLCEKCRFFNPEGKTSMQRCLSVGVACDHERGVRMFACSAFEPREGLR
jgi:hypothetical protein